MSNTDPYQPPEAELDHAMPATESGQNKHKLQGLGGWLILVGIGIVLSPVKIIVQMFVVYADVFTGEIWNTLTNPDADGFYPALATIIVTEVLINIGLIIGWLYIAYLFFSKKRSFPRWYIGILIFTLIFIVGDAVAIQFILSSGEVFDGDTMKDVVRTLISIAIWVPYMLVSKRVKVTFTH